MDESPHSALVQQQAQDSLFFVLFVLWDLPLIVFLKQIVGETSERWGGAHMGFSKSVHTILN